MASMNIAATLKDTLKKDRKKLSEFQTDHLNATITYLTGMKKDFNSARKDYEATMKGLHK